MRPATTLTPAPDARASSARRINRRLAVGLLVGLAVVYNTNGREIGTVDSQPAKFTAEEIAAHGTLRLDRIVAEHPGLAERPAFALDERGHYRSAYPIMPALIAAGPAFVLGVTRVLDLTAPLAPNAIAALTASLATSGAVALVFLSVCRLAPRRVALVTALGLGLGTNYWPLVSRTLWSHETVALGTACALWAWLRAPQEIRRLHLWVGGVGLAIAGAARPQIAPMIVVLLAWIALQTDLRRASIPAAVLAAFAVAQMAVNVHWFGSLLGATPRLESIHQQVHGVSGVLSAEPWVGALGLLVSPSRGIVIFSPVVILVAIGAALVRSAPRELRLRWVLGAAIVQFVAYTFYSVWWGGHTYGPRYLVDILVPCAPIAALAASRLSGSRAGVAAGSLLLAWSLVVAGLGAFVYPNDLWNTSPDDIDTHHERLWDVRDSQIVRAMHSDWSPQNFDLFRTGALRAR